MNESKVKKYSLTPTCVVCGSLRISVITQRLLRIEFSEDADFEDRFTMRVVNRDLGKQKAEVDRNASTLRLTTDYLKLEYCEPKNPSKGLTKKCLSVSFGFKGKQITWEPGQVDPENLKGTYRTLDDCIGNMWRPNKLWKKGKMSDTPIELEGGLVSRSGWSVIDDSDGIPVKRDENGVWVEEPKPRLHQDLYFFAYGDDFKQALKDAALIFGRQPLPPRFALGYWWSRYWAYRDEELLELASVCDKLDIPIDVMIIDMDWHLQNWTGFSWDRSYFPNPGDFLSRLQKAHLHTALNLHPAEGVGPHEDQYQEFADAVDLELNQDGYVPFDCANRSCIKAYFDVLLRPHEKLGVRFWWLDWQQGDTSGIPDLDPLPWLNRLHWEDQAENYPDRRPLLFSRYGGIGSGRHPVGFSGDTYCAWETLAYQPWFTATAANVLYGYWSHDIGGHLGPTTPELFTRWMQFGLYSPILRTHSSKQENCDRRFWEFEEPYNHIMIDAVRKRYELMPYIYTECRACYDSALSLCRFMYYEWPGEEAAYQCKSQYLFGSNLIVNPVVEPVDKKSALASVRTWLPDGEWIECAQGLHLSGEQKFTAQYALNEIPVFCKAGSVIPGALNLKRLLPGSYPDLLLTAYPGGTGTYRLYEDDGENNDYQKDICAWIPITFKSLDDLSVLTISPDEGGFEGFLNNRSLTVRLPLAGPPESVFLNGKKIPFGKENGPAWYYNGRNVYTDIFIPRISLDKEVIIEAKYESVAVIEAANGLKGIIARLFMAFESGRILEVPWERELALRTQIARKISAEPSCFMDEVRELKEWLRLLPDQYKVIKSGLFKEGRFHRFNFSAFEKTWKLLMDAVYLLTVKG